jgi:hypothetical protein
MNTATLLAMSLLFLVLAIAGAFFGLGRGIVSLYRSAATRRQLAGAAKTLDEGRLTEALAAYLKAEASWNFNSHDGRQPSLSKDIETYAAITSGIFHVVGKQSTAVRTNVNGILSEMKGFLKQHPYFRVDPRRTKAELLERWEVMRRRLEAVRSDVRSVVAVAHPRGR